MLLRVGKRRTSWELSNIDVLINVEFRTGDGDGDIDLNPSVYHVEPHQVVQTVAEHAAGSRCDPPRGFPNIDLNIGQNAADTPGETGFAFTTKVHRELAFANTDELRVFLSSRIVPEESSRKHTAAAKDVKAYVVSRRDAGDPEWTSFLSTTSKNWPTR